MLFKVVAVFALTATAASKTLPSPERYGFGARLLKALGEPFSPSRESGDSALCIAQSEYFLQGLRHLSPWALKMYDASTKVPSALIAGNLWQLGGFDQCVEISHESGGKLGTIEGKYCTVSIDLSDPNQNNSQIHDKDLTFSKLIGAAFEASGLRGRRSKATASWSLCVPAGCSSSDVANAVRARLAMAASPELPPKVQVGNEACHVDSDAPAKQPFSASEVAFLSAVTLLVLTAAVGTTYDLIRGNSAQSLGRTGPGWETLLLAFSIRRSGKQLLAGSPQDTLGCLHGLRVLSTGWVILLHSAYVSATSPNANSALLPKLGDSWENMIVMNATLSTDTFFLLSGLLLARGFLRKRDRFNPITFYWHRFMRLTPVYMALIWFYATVLYRLGSGPLWHSLVGFEKNNCVANWWTNLLFVNNYVDVGNPCMQHTWYLAVDMQLVLASPLILIPLRSYPRIGSYLLTLILIAAISAPFAVTFVDKLSPAMLYTLDAQMLGEVYLKIYRNMYTRAGPYLIGIALAFYMHQNRTRQLRLPKSVVVLAWVTSAVCCLAVIFGVFSFYQVGHPYNALEAATYASFHRSAWACGVAWIVFACVHGYGGILNGFLSWGAFIPLSRLSFSVYLCHYFFILIRYGRTRTPGYFDQYDVVQGMISTMIIALGCAAVLFILVEYPFQCLDRLLTCSRVESGAITVTSITQAPVEGTLHTVNVHSNIVAGLEPEYTRGYDNAGYDKTLEEDHSSGDTSRRSQLMQ